MNSLTASYPPLATPAVPGLVGIAADVWGGLKKFTDGLVSDSISSAADSFGTLVINGGDAPHSLSPFEGKVLSLRGGAGASNGNGGNVSIEGGAGNGSGGPGEIDIASILATLVRIGTNDGSLAVASTTTFGFGASATSGYQKAVRNLGSFSPASGTASWASLELNNTINGVSTGNATALAIASVTNTLTGGTISLIDAGTSTTDYGTGFTRKFRVDLSGNVRTAGFFAALTSSSAVKITGEMADGASAIALIVDTSTAWANTAATLLSLRTNAVEKLFVTRDGSLSSAGSVYGTAHRGTGAAGANLVGSLVGAEPQTYARIAAFQALSNSASRIASFGDNYGATGSGFVEKAWVNSDGSFVSNFGGSGGASTGKANFIVANNPGASSPAMANFTDVLELGGRYHSSVGDSSACIYLGALCFKTAGPILSVLQSYGNVGGTEHSIFDVLFDGSINVNNVNIGTQASPGRVINTTGNFYLQSSDYFLITNSHVSSDVVSFYSGAGLTQVASISHGGGYVSLVASGGDAVKLLDGARVNFSTADTKSFIERRAAHQLGTDADFAIGPRGFMLQGDIDANFLYCNGSFRATTNLYADGKVYTAGYVESTQSGAAATAFYASGATSGAFQAANTVRLLSGAADGASAVSIACDSANAFTDLAARLFSIRNAGVEKAWVNVDGKFTLHGVISDQDYQITGGAQLLIHSGFIQWETAGQGMFNSGGNLPISGNPTDGSTAIAITLKSAATLANATAKLVSLVNNSTEKAYFDKDGYLFEKFVVGFSDNNALLDLGGGGARAKLKYSNTSVACDADVVSITTGAADGASAVGFIVNLGNVFTTAGSKIASFRNSTEKASIGFDGTVTSSNGLHGEQLSVITKGSSTGSPGNATLNTGFGRSKIAAGAASCTITNSRMLSGSNVMLTPLNGDATCTTIYVSAVGAGSFTVSAYPAAPTADFGFAWLLVV